MVGKQGAAVVGGTFSDRAQAQAAFDALLSESPEGSADVAVAFYGSHGDYLLVAAANTPGAEERVARVLREHGAATQGWSVPDSLSGVRDELAHDRGGTAQRSDEERAWLARWAATAILYVEQGLLGPSDLLALLVAASDQSRPLSAEERRRRLKEADEELTQVSKQLESKLRARDPSLFDQHGRLRRTELTRRLSARTGGRGVLSGGELSALEDEADAAAGQSVRAP